MLPNGTQTRITSRYGIVGPVTAGTPDPIQGFEGQPLVSLSAAVEPLVNIVANIQQMVSTVLSLCPAPTTDGLSIDESASIILYTLEWHPSEHSFYIKLNEKLRSENREHLVPWFLYLRLLLAALSKLPSTTDQNVYRGVKRDISGQYQIGEICRWQTFSSCSTTVGVIEQFLGQTGPRTLFTIRCKTGKRICDHSCHPEEDEVLLPVATYFKIVTNLNQGNGLHIIQLEEIPRPSPSPPSRNQPLVDQIETYSIYSEVDLRGQKLTDEDMAIVIDKAVINKKCAELHLQNNMISSQGVSAIALGLQSNTTLQKLWLDSNRVSDIGVDALAKILSNHSSTLKMLGLNANEITDEGARHLAEMLKTNTTLTLLRLSHNVISDGGVQLLADALTHHNNTLQSMDLSSNKLVTDFSIDYLMPMIIHNRSLSTLSISDCGLSENGKEMFRSMGQSKYGFKLSL